MKYYLGMILIFGFLGFLMHPILEGEREIVHATYWDQIPTPLTIEAAELEKDSKIKH